MSEPPPPDMPTVRSGEDEKCVTPTLLGASGARREAPDPTSPPEDAVASQGRPFGRYRLLSELGHGGMGVVWRAWDTRLCRVVALKQILAQSEMDPEQVERFLREARLAAKLSHPNIVQVHDVGSHEGQYYLTCDCVEGRPLAEVMKSPVSPAKAAAWVRQVAEALAYAHEQGVVHRDVKPQNILVDAAEKPYVMDFGLAKDVDSAAKAALTETGQLLGTPTYMSPEQAGGGARGVGPASDQFSLGVVLYQLLTERVPFEGSTLRDLLNKITEADPVAPSSVKRSLHRDIEAICLKAMERVPSRRYPSMREFADDLGRYLAGEAILARRAGAVGRVWRKAMRSRRVVVPRAALAVVALAALAWVVAGSVRNRRRVDALLASARLEESRAQGLASDASKEEPRVAALEAARDAFKEASSRDSGRSEAKEGLDRVTRALGAIDESRRQAEQEAVQLIEAGRPALDDAEGYLYDKEAAYDELARRVAKAKEMFERAVAKAPRLALAHYLLGRTWKLLGWPDRAEACWGESIRLDPRFAPTHFHLGMEKLEQALVERTILIPGETAEQQADRANALLVEARLSLEEAAGLPLPAGDVVSRDLLDAALALARQDGARVREVCHRALERVRDARGSEWFYFLMACTGDDDEREKQTDRALSICPRHALSLFLRACVRAGRKDVKGAMGDYDHAIAIDPRFAQALINRATLRLASGDPQGAIEDYSRAIDVGSRFAVVLRSRAEARYRSGDIDGALADLGRAVANDPRDAVAWWSRGGLRLQRRDVDGALADFDHALKIDPRMAVAISDRGSALMEKGDLDGAIAEFGRALAIDPRLAEAVQNRGRARQAKGDLQGALADFTLAIEINPRHAQTWVDRGALRAAKGDLDGAIDDYGHAIALDPRSMAGFVNRGCAFIRKDDLKKARADFDRAVEIDPRSAEAFASRANVRYAEGDYAGAAQDFEKALAVAPLDWPHRQDVEEKLEDSRRAQR